MLFQADHVAFSIFPVSSWAEIKAVCASQLADESVRGRKRRRKEEQSAETLFNFSILAHHALSFPFSLSIKNFHFYYSRRCKTSG